METVPEEEQTPRASKEREERGTSRVSTSSGRGRGGAPFKGDQVTHRFFKEQPEPVLAEEVSFATLVREAVQGGCLSQPVSLMVTHS